jgi:hypothetical protein
MAAQDLLRAKLDLESRLRARTSHPWLCAAGAGECLAAYAELLSLDWDQSRLPGRLPILVAADTPAASGSDLIVLPLRQPASQREAQLGTRPGLEPSGVVPGHLDSALDGGRPLPPPPTGDAPGSCAGSQAFYDHLFAADDIAATIVFGYLDQHLDTLRGYLRHVLLRLDPIPVFLGSQEDMRADVRSRFAASGFGEESSTPTELRLARRFYYRQRLKTLHVRVVFSIARCPDETPDPFGRLWRYDDQTCPDQRRATARARGSFAGGFATSAILMYHGHSRRGRGLDFGPMSLGDGRLTLSCESIGCDRGDTTQTLLFVNSCGSVAYYGEAIAKVRRALPAGRQLAWLGIDGDMRIMDGPQVSLRLLDMLVEARCPREILAVLNLPLPDGYRSRALAEGF